MFRWIVIPILMILIGGLVINEINKATATKAVAFQVPVVIEKQPVSNQSSVTGVVEISGSKTDGPVITPAGKPLAFQPLVISNARINAVERQEIPSEKEGKLLFVGTDVKPNRDVPTKDQFQLRIGYLLVEIEKDEQVPSTNIIKVPSRPEKIYRRWKEGDPLAPSKVYLDYENKTFFKLEVGDEVNEGQLVGLVNPVLALDDLSIRAAKLDASEADRRASEKTRDEAHKRFQQQALLRQKGAGSEEDYRSAELFWRRYIEEELGKASLVVQSQRELSASVTTLKMHEIRSTIPGVIKAIYKSRGEAIKNLEPVLQVQNRNRLRVEGLVEIQDSRAIQRDSKVIVEPSQPEQPKLVLRGHLLDVSCVSVCKGDSTVILSGSEDQSVRGW
ncbi:MAG: HlyD family efflux transporter periplasmic adaptor subunit, partial [Planctomycetia bacterium]